jgi:hypothetical protein
VLKTLGLLSHIYRFMSFPFVEDPWAVVCIDRHSYVFEVLKILGCCLHRYRFLRFERAEDPSAVVCTDIYSWEFNLLTTLGLLSAQLGAMRFLSQNLGEEAHRSQGVL